MLCPGLHPACATSPLPARCPTAHHPPSGSSPICTQSLGGPVHSWPGPSHRAQLLPNPCPRTRAAPPQTSLPAQHPHSEADSVKPRPWEAGSPATRGGGGPSAWALDSDRKGHRPGLTVAWQPSTPDTRAFGKGANCVHSLHNGRKRCFQKSCLPPSWGKPCPLAPASSPGVTPGPWLPGPDAHGQIPAVTLPWANRREQGHLSTHRRHTCVHTRVCMRPVCVHFHASHTPCPSSGQQMDRPVSPLTSVSFNTSAGPCQACPGASTSVSRQRCRVWGGTRPGRWLCPQNRTVPLPPLGPRAAAPSPLAQIGHEPPGQPHHTAAHLAPEQKFCLHHTQAPLPIPPPVSPS